MVGSPQDVDDVITQASAITLHKSQGGTYASVGYEYARTHPQKLVYVALSRCTNLNGIYLTNCDGDHTFYHREANPDKPMVDEFRRLESHRLHTVTQRYLAALKEQELSRVCETLWSVNSPESLRSRSSTFALSPPTRWTLPETPCSAKLTSCVSPRLGITALRPVVVVRRCGSRVRRCCVRARRCHSPSGRCGRVPQAIPALQRRTATATAVLASRPRSPRLP
ncbi:hypothetical protein HPB49_008702 [Dermacentor silvarum]|uniref:Uncharacterized protein n=1 Tax=Dermacentor silvarum TaxID=543639 RepID=A0ACB8DC52_DERSI|nr:hypothetical protein HPB49_008702 [Dermacentor silvarum]